MAARVAFSALELLCSFPFSLQESASQLSAWAQGHRVATVTSKAGLADPSAISGLQVIRGLSSYHLCSPGRPSYKFPALWLDELSFRCMAVAGSLHMGGLFPKSRLLKCPVQEDPRASTPDKDCPL